MRQAPREFEPADRARLVRYIRANLMVVIGADVGLFAIYLFVLHSGWILIDIALVAVVIAALLVARRVLEGGTPMRALYLIAAGNWLAAITTTAITPFVLPLITPVVLLPIMLMVPHLERLRLSIMMLVAVSVAAVSAVLAELALVDVEQQAPDWLRNLIVLTAVPVVVGLVAFTAWQNHLSLGAQTLALRESRARVVAAADEERRRIERDLHDGTQQRLVSVAVQLGLLRRLIAKDPERAAALSGALSSELDEAMAELRNLAHGIYPPLLEQRGLAEALTASARRSPCPVVIEPRDVARYEPEIERAVYFCCLEAMQNVAKHAADATITLVIDGRRGLVVDIVDDGVGFDPLVVDHGHGFANMGDRVSATGGSLRVDAATGRGTRVRLSYPMVTAIS